MRVTSSADDDYIDALVKAARRHTEHVTKRALITQTLVDTRDGFPSGRIIELERPPLQSVTSVEYKDESDQTQTFASSKYTVDTKSSPGRIILNDDQTWPTTSDNGNALTVTYVAGFGDDATDVPWELVHAIKFLVADWYENRETEVIVAGIAAHQVSNAFTALTSPWRQY